MYIRYINKKALVDENLLLRHEYEKMQAVTRENEELKAELKQTKTQLEQTQAQLAQKTAEVDRLEQEKQNWAGGW